jgi:uncharacterized protein (TIGR02466 family)
MTEPPRETSGGQGEAKADLRLLFPTPVAVVDVPGLRALNGEFSQAILARRKSHPASTDASNLGGWQSDWDMASWGGVPTQRLLDTIKGFANKLTVTRRGEPVNVAWRANAWANVNGPGNANEFHIHPGSAWSGVYYVDDGGIAANPALGGELELKDPRGAAPAMYAPHLTYAGPGGPSAGASELIRPKSGLLVLFPAWLYHQVRPYRGNALRISIAFNLSV